MWVMCGKGTRKTHGCTAPGGCGIRPVEDVWLCGCHGVSSELRAVVNFMSIDGFHPGEGGCFPRIQAESVIESMELKFNLVGFFNRCFKLGVLKAEWNRCCFRIRLDS